MKYVIWTLLTLVLLALIAAFVIKKFFWKQFVRFSLRRHPGNAPEYATSAMKANSASVLQGKTIIFLGSSVTVGACSCNNSFVEYLKVIDGVKPVKEAVSGTTLVNNGSTSYIPRMETIDKAIPADAFICQLSTNDATTGQPMGQISPSFDRADFDTATVAGAIEYIIAYARDTWHCPVLFYTGIRYNSPAYGEMVALLHRIQEKWDIGVIDLWTDDSINDIPDADRKIYMADGIHPTKAGYLKWWLPHMQNYLYSYLRTTK